MFEKNLILIHLESLNDAIYLNGAHLFPNINRIAQESFRCRNFYATATSTVMVLSDFMYGNIHQYEKSLDLTHLQSNHEKESIFEKLKKEDYQVESYIYPKFGRNHNTSDFKEILGENDLFLETDEYTEFIENIERVISSSEKYGLYVYDWTSLNDSTSARRNECEPGWHNVFENRYKKIDETVDKVFEILKKYKKLDNTTVVLFGDHGDDMWSHGLGKGFTHAVEPYLNLIKVPVFIYDADAGNGDIDNLLNTSDMAEVIERFLKKDINKEELIRYKFRDYSFSRNLFVGQKSKVLNKGYSVTDGKYQLQVSKYGLELYMCRYSCYSQINMLNFFELTDGKIRLRKGVDRISGRHFLYAFLYQEEEIRKEYEKLLPVLKEQIATLAQKAGTSNETEKWFKAIRYDKTILKTIRKNMWDEKIKVVRALLHL